MHFGSVIEPSHEVVDEGATPATAEGSLLTTFEKRHVGNLLSVVVVGGLSEGLNNESEGNLRLRLHCLL